MLTTSSLHVWFKNKHVPQICEQNVLIRYREYFGFAIETRSKSSDTII